MPCKVKGQKRNANFFCTKLLKNPSGHGRPRRKSGTSAPKSAFFCGPIDGEKLFDSGASKRNGQECPREIRTEKFMFMLFWMLFRPTFRAKSFESSSVSFSRFFPRFQSVLVNFSQFQSVLVSFSQFQADHTRQKRRNFLPIGRWGETAPKLFVLP